MLSGFPGGTSGKESVCQCRRCQRCRFDPWVRNIPWRRKCQLIPVFLPGESQGQRSLVGYSLWGLKRVRHDWASPHTHHPWVKKKKKRHTKLLSLGKWRKNLPCYQSQDMVFCICIQLLQMHLLIEKIISAHRKHLISFDLPRMGFLSLCLDSSGNIILLKTHRLYIAK